MLPGPGPVLCMVCERHVILKTALHSGLYSCLAAATYISMLYCLVYSVLFKSMLVYISCAYKYNYYIYNYCIELLVRMPIGYMCVCIIVLK